MTLMPVSNIWARGSSWSKAGALRWISQYSSMPSMESVSSGWPSTLKTWPSTALPTGTVMPRPRLRTGAPRTRPSVCCMQMQRTRPSPICWATSAVTWWAEPSSSMVNSTAWLISGRACGGNSTSMTGPAMATTRPSASVPAGDVSCRVVVVIGSSSLRLAERFGPADDLHDLGGDGILTGAVHHARQGADELVRVVGGRCHGALLGREEGGGTFEEGGEDLRLEGPGGQPEQQLRGLGLELGVTLQRPVVLLVLVPGTLGKGERQQLLTLDPLGPGGDEPGRDQLHEVDLAGRKRRGHDRRDVAGVGELGTVGETRERLRQLDAPEPEVGRGLLAHRPHRHLGAVPLVLDHEPLGGPQRARIVGPRQAPVARDGQDPDVARGLGRAEQQPRRDRIGRRGQPEDPLHPLAERPVGRDPRLGAYDPRGGDELHRLGD